MKNKENFFRKMAAPLILGVMVVLFTACKEELPKYQVIDLGDIPEEYLATVPYQNGDIVKMMHESSRLVINYRVVQECFYPLDDPSGWTSSPINYDYQVVFTELEPDYPTFKMQIVMTSEYKRYELEGGDAPKTGLIMLKGSDTYVPFINTDATGYTVLDSLEVNGHMYYDVFKLDCRHYEFPPDYPIQADSIYASTCYYNYAKGFIGVELSNGEKYLLFEE